MEAESMKDPQLYYNGFIVQCDIQLHHIERSGFICGKKIVEYLKDTNLYPEHCHNVGSE